jgi:hypothetical protein
MGPLPCYAADETAVRKGFKMGADRGAFGIRDDLLQAGVQPSAAKLQE